MGLRHMVWLPALILLTACTTSGPAYGPPPEDVAAVVVMTSTLAFEPRDVTVRAGDVIEWRNRSLFTHTVTFDPARADEADDISLPADVRPFFSGRIAPGQIYRHRFGKAGTYRYVCEPHEGLAMAGTVMVKP